ncbi:MAG: FTR1 family protein [Byssovorax sp.]
MIVNFRRALLLLLVLLLVPRAAAADEGDSPETEAQRLAHILGYTASDYGGAVQKGAIVNATEFEEQLTLLKDAAKIAARIGPKAPAESGAGELVGKVDKVKTLVESKAPEEQVGAAVEDVRALLTRAFHLSEAPAAPPEPNRGKILFLEHCATCHGQTGLADTPRAASLDPRPANFHDPRIADPLTPLKVAGTVRFGISGTAMAPFTFLSDADRWALGFYVVGLRHGAAPASDSPTYTVAELALRSDAQIRDELTAAGIPEARFDAVLADLRRRAPYEDRVGKNPLTLARVKLDRARVALSHGDRDVARSNLVDAYLEGIEPVEGALRAIDASLVTALEERFVSLRSRLEGGAPPDELESGVAGLLRDLTRAELVLAAQSEKQSFLSTAISSGGILLREGVEAALLIAALLGIATQAMMGSDPAAPGAGSAQPMSPADRKRYVHYGWMSALALGLVTFFASSRLITLSGASRELIEGVTALLATLVLFYVSWSLLAKKEVARWMKFLRAQVSPRRAALSLFGVSFLAAYREAFETVLFYQALLSSKASIAAALAGAAGGAALLAALVVAYTRAGRFAPPQVFFKISSYLLYALAVVFAGQGIAALQLTGHAPIHTLAIPSVPALGLHPTVETCAAQGLLLALAVAGLLAERKNAAAAPVAAKAPAA